MTGNKKENTSTRRDFLKKSGYVTGGVVGGSVLGGLLGNKFGTSDNAPLVASEVKQHDQALEYFTSKADFKLLSQATERIFPEDENGPGAIGLGVPYYIDHQLAGKWGINAKEYRQGPFYEGEDVQGYQSQLRYHQLYDLGIEAIEKHSQSTFGESFTINGILQIERTLLINRPIIVFEVPKRIPPCFTLGQERLSSRARIPGTPESSRARVI